MTSSVEIIKGRLRPVKHAVLRALRVRQLQQVIKRIESQHRPPEQMAALEIFGGRGDIHLHDYANRVRSLEIWELNADYCSYLQKFFPIAKVKCVDSYDEINHCSTRFDMVVSDNPMQVEGGHFEHFDLFPRIGRILSEDAVLILGVLPVLNDRYRKTYARLYQPEHLRARAAFYEARDPMRIGPEKMRQAYAAQLRDACRRLTWWFVQPRNKLLSYFVCGVAR